MMQKSLFSLLLLVPTLVVSINESRFNLDERNVAYAVRGLCAMHQTLQQSPNDIDHNNGDQESVPDFAAQFTKLLAHNPTTSAPSLNGQCNYEKLVVALNDGKQESFNAIKMSGESIRQFVNPQGSFAYSLEGKDSSLFHLPVAFKMDSPDAAVDLLEVYLQMICRDVAFQDYGTGQGSDADPDGGSYTNKAAAVLQSLSQYYHGPRNAQGVVDASVLFRGNSYDSFVGPYVSQFLLVPFFALFPSSSVGNVGELTATEQYVPIAQQHEFGVSWDDFLAIQNGNVPVDYVASDFNQETTRHIVTGRDAGSYVHNDRPQQPYVNALNVLNYTGAANDILFPYTQQLMPNEDPFVTMGPVDQYSILGAASKQGMQAAWAQKWRANRRLRPEAMAGLVQSAKVSGQNPYGLNQVLFGTHAGVNVLEWVKAHNLKQADPAVNPDNTLTPEQAATYLLGQMYPEGSPTHPSYPAGHATNAGASVTVLKAMVDDTLLIKDLFTPVKVDPNNPRNLVPLVGEGENEMTVASELDKLASNIALARDFAGVHYRSDGDEGILLGEQVAIYLLQDHARTYAEPLFKGFELTKRDGTRIRITAETVQVLN